MKVLYLIDSLQAGGAERSLTEMLPRLAERGVEPVVACLRRSDDGLDEQVRTQFDLRFVPARRPLGRVAAVRRILETERPALVHTTLLASDLLGRFAAAGTGVPVLTSLVNTSYDPIRLSDPRLRPWAFRGVRAVDAWTSRRLTAHFHAITVAVKDHNVAALRIPQERVTVIERGRDPDRLGTRSPERRRTARERLGLADADEVVVNVARQEYQKGQRHLLEAIGGLAASRPRLVVLVVGRRGAASTGLDAMCQRPAIRKRVRFLGYRPDAPDVLAAADLFVFPSLFEGLGGSLIEAMALGLPIVASDLAAVREVVEPGGNATLVPPGDPVRLAEAIGQLLDDGAAAFAYGARSRRIFEERFTLDRSVERMADLYRSIVGRAREGRTVRIPGRSQREEADAS